MINLSYFGFFAELRFCPIRGAMLLCFISLVSCSEEDKVENGAQGEGNALDRREKIRQLEMDLEILRWEKTRLSLKIRTVDGSALVRDKKSDLWHFDVERSPFTGMAVENFEDGTPRAEASFLRGKKDGMERFWYRNGVLKEESQWFNGLANGIIRTWREDGRLLRALRYKKGELIEVIRD